MNWHSHIYNGLATYVTGFGKMCIVHTSNFAYLEIHRNYREWFTGKFETFGNNNVIVAVQSLIVSYQNSMSLPRDFMHHKS